MESSPTAMLEAAMVAAGAGPSEDCEAAAPSRSPLLRRRCDEARPRLLPGCGRRARPLMLAAFAAGVAGFSGAGGGTGGSSGSDSVFVGASARLPKARIPPQRPLRALDVCGDRQCDVQDWRLQLHLLIQTWTREAGKSGSTAAASDANSRRGIARRQISSQALCALLGLSTATPLWAPSKAAVAEAPAEGESTGSRNDMRQQLRRVGQYFDKLQEDVFECNWRRVLNTEDALRRLLPLFRAYAADGYQTDSMAGRESRIAMGYEVDRLENALNKLSEASDTKTGDMAIEAFADVSLSFDRYAKAGDLYEGRDPVVSTAVLYSGIANRELNYLSPKKSPPRVKDLVLVLDGPDKGRTGTMLGFAAGFRKTKDRDNSPVVAKEERLQKAPDDVVIRFDGGIGEGPERLQETKLVPYKFVARQKRGPDVNPLKDPLSLPPI
eukprot:TRINITY_DN64167_c0_g1_i1.p1 TRINITY_DN64167_c0_g1~~TRINITY_DN64167_c0_g1_i1.p1  ORF type:complete len:439 (+),score=100.43 TRINITY_DN64167_c0_g1_i1:97-1413(+)